MLYNDLKCNIPWITCNIHPHLNDYMKTVFAVQCGYTPMFRAGVKQVIAYTVHLVDNVMHRHDVYKYQLF